MDKTLPYKMDKPLSVMHHLEELRNRILFSLFLIILCTALAYSFVTQIMSFLVRSIGKLYFMSPAEAF